MLIPSDPDWDYVNNLCRLSEVLHSFVCLNLSHYLPAPISCCRFSTFLLSAIDDPESLQATQERSNICAAIESSNILEDIEKGPLRKKALHHMTAIATMTLHFAYLDQDIQRNTDLARRTVDSADSMSSALLS